MPGTTITSWEATAIRVFTDFCRAAGIRPDLYKMEVVDAGEPRKSPGVVFSLLDPIHLNATHMIRVSIDAHGSSLPTYLYLMNVDTGAKEHLEISLENVRTRRPYRFAPHTYGAHTIATLSEGDYWRALERGLASMEFERLR